MILPAIPDIIKDFKISYNTSSWILASFLITGAVMTPVAGRLSDMYGKKKMLLLIVGIYTIGISTAAISTNAELDGFVDVLARRIASFDRRPFAAAKNLINQVSLPYADRLLDALNAFQTALTWPETQQRIQALLKRGLQREGDFENRWPALLGTLLET
jgi:MFS family permease